MIMGDKVLDTVTKTIKNFRLSVKEHYKIAKIINN